MPILTRYHLIRSDQITILFTKVNLLCSLSLLWLMQHVPLGSSWICNKKKIIPIGTHEHVSNVLARPRECNCNWADAQELDILHSPGLWKTSANWFLPRDDDRTDAFQPVCCRACSILATAHLLRHGMSSTMSTTAIIHIVCTYSCPFAMQWMR